MSEDQAQQEERSKKLAARAYLQSQYRSQDNLAIRIRTHELYSENQLDFAAWILDALSWQGDEVVLDAGCGAGFYIDAVRQRTSNYIASDLSLGMLQSLRQPVPRINLDAQWLPFSRATVDVILANHMLYHIPDINQALSEFRRVMQPRGRLIAATNSDRTMAELEALQREAMTRLGLSDVQHFGTRLSFTLENGADILSRYFSRVERHQLYDALVFPEVQPVIDYIGSSFERHREHLPQHLTWADVAETLRIILEKKIARYGEYRVNKLSGFFLCWNE